MKLIVDIPYEIYKDYMTDRIKTTEVLQAVRHGQPLPKGHSDLIDADATFTKLNERIHVVDAMMAEHGPYINNEIPFWMWSALIEDTTIIKADKE